MAIVTLIAAGRLDDRLIDRALGALREIDPKARFAGWIDEGDAVDLSVSGDGRAIRWGLESLPQVDVFVQPDEPRFRRLLVADMDSTIVGQECLDELADFAGLKSEIAEITERAMQGKLDFKAALRERVALLSGLDEEAIARCLSERVIPESGRGDAGANDARRRSARSWSPAASSPSPSRSPRCSASTRACQPAAVRRPAAQRLGRGPDRRCSGQARRADRGARGAWRQERGRACRRRRGQRPADGRGGGARRRFSCQARACRSRRRAARPPRARRLAVGSGIRKRDWVTR